MRSLGRGWGAPAALASGLHGARAQRSVRAGCRQASGGTARPVLARCPQTDWGVPRAEHVMKPSSASALGHDGKFEHSKIVKSYLFTSND